MASKLAAKFDRELSDLFDDRIHQIRSYVWPTRGAAPKVTKTRVKESIARLQALAERAVIRAKDGKRVFSGYDHKKQWHPKKGKGVGRPEKARQFKLWYDKNITTKNCVYVFWARKKCLYVGRTLNGKGRPSSHFEKHWFSAATRLDIFSFDRKREVPRFECMFTHKHRPSRSKMKPSKKKYYARCQVCEARELVSQEVKWLFRLK